MPDTGEERRWREVWLTRRTPVSDTENYRVWGPADHPDLIPHPIDGESCRYVPEAALAKAQEERDREKALREDAYRYQQAAEDLLNPEQKRVAELEEKLAKARKEGREEAREALKSEEAIEAAARAIYRSDTGGTDRDYAKLGDFPRLRRYPAVARAALNYALDALTKEGD